MAGAGKGLCTCCIGKIEKQSCCYCELERRSNFIVGSVPDRTASLYRRTRGMRKKKAYPQPQQANEDPDPEQENLALVFPFGCSNPNYVVEHPHCFQQIFERSDGGTETWPLFKA